MRGACKQGCVPLVPLEHVLSPPAGTLGQETSAASAFERRKWPSKQHRRPPRLSLSLHAQLSLPLRRLQPSPCSSRKQAFCPVHLRLACRARPPTGHRHPQLRILAGAWVCVALCVVERGLATAMSSSAPPICRLDRLLASPVACVTFTNKRK